MAKIGDWVILTSLRERPAGVYLDAGELGEVLLPRREMPQGHVVGEEVQVFLHTDSEDRLVACARRPLVMPGEWGLLRCVSVSKTGAFMDWGLAKDLLVPFREQTTRMTEGRNYPVWVKVDPVSQRIVGTTRLARELDRVPHTHRVGDKVELVIFGRSPLGWNAVVDGTHTALLYADGVFEELRMGERRTGYITEVRPDGKLDASLQPPGRARVDDLEKQILAELEARGGFWAIGDHTPSEEIREELGVSKRTFKQSVGALLKKRRITIDGRGMRLSPE
jgi:predicted RNA-binding protein (virulence factor B family)